MLLVGDKDCFLFTRYGITNAITAFGIECNGNGENVSQCLPMGTLCRADDPEFAVAIECGGAIDESECHYLPFVSHRIYDVYTQMISLSIIIVMSVYNLVRVL